MSGTADKAARGFTLTSAMNLKARKHQWLVDGLFLEVGLSLITAKPKVGKSTFSRQLAYSVAEGVDFLNAPAKQGDVLYFSLEGPEDVVKEHLVALGYAEKRGIVHVVHELMPFHGEQGLTLLDETLAQLQNVRLVVLDPAHKFLRPVDSDKYDVVSAALEKLEAVAKKHRLQIQLVAHGKKRATADAGDSTIGSTAYRGGTDSNVYLTKIGMNRFIETEQRRGNALEQTHLIFDSERQALSLGTSVEQEQEERGERKQRKTLERIEQEIWAQLCLLKNPTQGELLGFVTGKTELKIEVLEKMAADGRVSKTQDGRALRFSAVLQMEGAA
jgi:RecA-family ATPase